MKDVRSNGTTNNTWEPRGYTANKSSPSKNVPVAPSRGGEERTIRAVIPTTHLGKVEIPEAYVEATAGKSKYTSTNGVGQDFSVCVKHMKGECSMGQNCRQLHVSPAWFKHTDFERRSKLTCCGECGDYNSTPELLRTLESVQVQFTAEGNSKHGAPVVGTKFGNTKGFRERLAKAQGKRIVTIPVREVCRLHQNDECHFGNDCTRIHVCRSLASALNLPPVPRKNKVYAEETRRPKKEMEKETHHHQSHPEPSPANSHATPPHPHAHANHSHASVQVISPSASSSVMVPAPLDSAVRVYTPSPTNNISSPSSPRDDIWAVREDVDAWDSDQAPVICLPPSYNKLRTFAPTALLPSCINDLSLLSEECSSPLSCVKKCIREVLGPVTPTMPTMGFLRAF